MKVLSIQELLLINQYVQSIVSRDTINNWFLSMTESDKQSIVKSIWILATQAHVKEDDIIYATKISGLKTTHTPVIIISTGSLPLQKRGYRLSSLSGAVLDQAFCLVLECLVIADSRRKKQECIDNCSHWWHKDLSNKQIVNEIISKYTI